MLYVYNIYRKKYFKWQTKKLFHVIDEHYEHFFIVNLGKWWTKSQKKIHSLKYNKEGSVLLL